MDMDQQSPRCVECKNITFSECINDKLKINQPISDNFNIVNRGYYIDMITIYLLNLKKSNYISPLLKKLKKILLKNIISCFHFWMLDN